jgi:SAM-dependent methyltransferase
MKHGDFTALAEDYVYRPAYSPQVLDALLRYMNPERSWFQIAEIGAGTGKLTRMLLERSLAVTPVEPNDAMREKGIDYTSSFPVEWRAGSGEATGLPTGRYDWVVMASSFHWTDPARSLPELHRILRPGGHFTAVWNPRHLEVSPLHSRIEQRIREIVPEMKRVSSGARSQTRPWETVITSSGHFEQVIFMEVDHLEIMDRERFMGAWRSVNDIRVQAGEERFRAVLEMIEREIGGLEAIEVPYKIRAWTGRRTED